MPLAPGTKLGPYEIVSALGAGGMGEVYRARDTRLRREVAVKVLPATFSSDPERLQRFEQEALAAGTLNHPNILVVYDVGNQDGVPYIVCELLEGSTLLHHMRNGALPLRRSLDIAVQVTRAIAAAHEKGIVHRDLKPANLFVTTEGRVKILDFGLAKLLLREDVGAGKTVSFATKVGQVLGTVGYMSPEQVRGEAADHRSDIFALGAILYEMLAGRRAFQKDTAAETMTAILKEEPLPITTENKKIPPAVERIALHCLEKNPSERFQSARDLAFDLESLSGISTTNAEATERSESSRRWWLVPLTALFLLGMGLALGGLLGARRNSITPPGFEQLTFKRGFLYSARFAPDGNSVVYSASWDGKAPTLYSMRLDGPESRALDVSNSVFLAMSPESELAISRECKYLVTGECIGILARMPNSGGAPRDLLEGVNSADWAEQGQLAVTRQAGSKFRVEFPVRKVLFETADEWLGSIRMSPNKEAIALAESPMWQGDAGNVVILDREGKELVRSGFYWSVEGLSWSARGDEVWFMASKNQQWANELHGLSLSGKDRLILRIPGIARLHDVSRDGRLLLSREIWRGQIYYRSSTDKLDRDLSWLDYSIATDLSGDGEMLAFSEEGEATHNNFFSYMRRKDGSPAVKLGTWGRPVFSPDGKSVLVSVGTGEKLMILPTGVGESRQLNPSTILRFASPGWLPDGSAVVFAGNDGHGWRIYIQDLSGGSPRAITPLVSVRPERFESNLLSHDGNYVIARNSEGVPMQYPVTGGEPRPIGGMDSDDVWINWSFDDRSGYLFHWGEVPARVFRLDLTSGQRQLVTVISPTDPVGLTAIMTVRMTPDAKALAYTCDRDLSELFLVDGVK